MYEQYILAALIAGGFFWAVSSAYKACRRHFEDVKTALSQIKAEESSKIIPPEDEPQEGKRYDRSRYMEAAVGVDRPRNDLYH